MPVPFIADSYVRADDALRRISEQVSSYVTTGESAMATIAKVRDDLATMETGFPNGWLETVQFINQQADANPNDEAWQDLKRRTDKIVADFRSAKDRFEAVRDAISAP